MMEKEIEKMALYKYTIEEDFSTYDAVNIAFLRLAIDTQLFHKMKNKNVLDYKAVSQIHRKKQDDHFFTGNV